MLVYTGVAMGDIGEAVSKHRVKKSSVNRKAEMNVHIGRTIPPAAAPVYFSDILSGFKGAIRGRQEVDRRCSEIARYFNARQCWMVSSGKAALYLILTCLKRRYPHRQDVIIPAFCCYSVPSAIVRAGLNVTLCDIDPETLDYDYENLAILLKKYKRGKTGELDNRAAGNEQVKNDKLPGGKRPKGLLAVVSAHLFGYTAEVARVRSLVNDAAVTIVEDAAQVMGAARGDKKAGMVGDVGFFSLGRGKSISAIEGGVIVTSDPEIAQQLSELITYISAYPLVEKLKLVLKAVAVCLFQHPSVFWLPKLLPFLRIGDTIYDPDFNIFGLSSFQAGVFKSWKRKSAHFNEIRGHSGRQWSEHKPLASFATDYSNNGRSVNFIRYPVKIKNRCLWQHLLRISEACGLGIMHTYPDAINAIAEIKRNFKGQEYPAAHRLSRQLVTLPVHPFLSGRDKAKILMHLELVAKTNFYRTEPMATGL